MSDPRCFLRVRALRLSKAPTRSAQALSMVAPSMHVVSRVQYFTLSISRAQPQVSHIVISSLVRTLRAVKYFLNRNRRAPPPLRGCGAPAGQVSTESISGLERWAKNPTHAERVYRVLKVREPCLSAHFSQSQPFTVTTYPLHCITSQTTRTSNHLCTGAR